MPICGAFGRGLRRRDGTLVQLSTAPLLPLPPWGERVGVRGACGRGRLAEAKGSSPKPRLAARPPHPTLLPPRGEKEPAAAGGIRHPPQQTLKARPCALAP